MKKFIKISGALLLFGVLFVLCLHTSFAKQKALQFIKRYAQEQYHVQMDASSLDYDFIPLTIKFQNFRIYDNSGHTAFLRAESLQAKLHYSALWYRDFLAKSVFLNQVQMDPGSPPHPRIPSRSHLRIDELQFAGSSFGSPLLQKIRFQIDANISRDFLELKSFSARFQGGQIAASGTLKNFEHPIYRFTYTGLAETGSLSQSSPIQGKVTTSGTVDGSSRNYRIQGKLQSSLLSFARRFRFQVQSNYSVSPSGNSPVGRFQASLHEPTVPLNGFFSGTVRKNNVTLDQAKLSWASSHLSASGSLSPSTLDLQTDLALTRMTDLHSLGLQVPDLPGSYHVHSLLTGSYNDIHSNGMINIRKPDLSATFTGKGRLIDLHANLPESTGQADAHMNLASMDFQLLAEFAQTSLMGFIPRNSFRPETANLTGQLRANGNLKSWKDSSAHLQIESAEFSKDNIRVHVNNGSEATLLGQRLSMNLTGTLPEQGSFHFTGTLPLEQSESMNVSLRGQSDLKVVELFTDKVDASGDLDFDIRMTGRPSHPRYAGTVNANDCIVDVPAYRLHIANGAGDAGLSPEALALKFNGVLNSGSMQLTALIPFQQTAGEMHVAVHALPLSQFSSSLQGQMELRLDAQGKGRRMTDWTGNANLALSNARILNHEIKTQPAHASLSRGILRFDPLHMKSGSSFELLASGSMNFHSGGIHASIKNFTNLELVSQWVPNLRVAGKFFADLNATGKLTNPEYNGALTLRDANFRSSEFPLVVEQINATVPLQKHQAVIKDFSAKIAGGSTRGGGTIQLNGAHAGDIQAWLQCRNAGLNFPYDWENEINADLNFSKTGDSSLLSGKLLVLRSIFTKNVDPNFRLMTAFLSQKADLNGHSAPSSRLNVDLEIRNSSPIVVSNNLGDLQASVQLRVKGSSAKPQVYGELHIDPSSKLYLQTRIFSVDHGILRFQGSGAPVADIRISSTIPDDETKKVYKVTLPITGPLDRPDEHDPVSVPPLPTQQTYFLLLTGRTEAQLSRAESRFMNDQLLSYYSAKMVLPVPEKIAQDFTLHRAKIDPETISSERDPGGKLLKGKDYFKGVSLVYSHSLDQSSEQTWIANYQWKKDWSFRFIDQEDGTYSSDVMRVHRFGQRTAASVTQPKSPPPITIHEIQIDTDGNVNVAELQKASGLKQDEPYSPEKVHYAIALLKQSLQQSGYLFPAIELETQKISPGWMRLKFLIRAGGLRSMEFNGVTATEEQVKKYQRWWREGFSEPAILAMIQHDLLRALWLQGYDQGQIKLNTSKRNGNLVYSFEAVRGEQHQVQIQMQVPPEVKKDLEALYSSPAEMNVEVMNDFASFRQKAETAFAKNGYFNATIEQGPGETKGNLIAKKVDIVAGPQSRISEITVSEHQSLPPELRQQLKLTPGKLFSPDVLNEDELTIARYYEKRGYHSLKLHSEVRRKSGGSDLIVFYDLDTNGISRIASIDISGNQRTQGSVITKHLRFKEGDVLTQEALAQTQKNLSDTGLFQEVRVDAKEGPVPNQYDVIVRVVEEPNYQLSYGAGYNSEKSVEGHLQISDINFMGTGRSLSLIGKVNSEDEILRLVYHAPAIGGLRWKTLISGGYEQLEQPVFVTKTAAIQFQRQFQLQNPFALVTSYRFERVEVEEKDATDVRYIGEDPINISRLSAAVLADTRNDPLNPISGRFASIEFSYAPSFLGSQTEYVKNFSQFFSYKSFGKIVWASGIRLGFAKTYGDDLIATERFFAGGSFSVRGFEKDRLGPLQPVWKRPLGGEAIFIINQEVRFPLPIHEWLGAAIFYDAGNVYSSIHDFRPLDLRHSVGFGLRFNTPIGIGRFDWGINLRPREGERRSVFHIALGQAF